MISKWSVVGERNVAGVYIPEAIRIETQRPFETANILHLGSTKNMAARTKTM
jgi:hypothetical protein